MGYQTSMFRNVYDSDVALFSPTGRLYQVEYSKESVNQGLCCIGLMSRNHVVLGNLNKGLDRLSTLRHKCFGVDDHIGLCMSGIAADGRVLSDYMLNECVQHQL